MTKKDQLRELQLTELEILKEIKKICNKNKIKFFLIGGTLLGAVRHKGFIPWDDDIDIGMLREDYDKFIELCKNGALGKKYFLQCSNTDKNYYLSFGKVRKNNTSFCESSLEGFETHKGIFVDIFPYDNVPKIKGFKQKLQAFIYRSISDAITYKKKIYKLSYYRRKIAVLFFSLFPCGILFKIQDKVCRIWNKKDCDYIVCLSSTWGCERSTLERNMIFPLKEIEFENSKFFGMNNNDAYLTKSYGDYMKLPPVEKRKTHLPTYISFTEGENWINEN